MKIAGVRIIEKAEFQAGMIRIWLEAPEIAEAARPGQFVMVRCGEDTLLRRPLSVHQVDGDKIALLFSIAGKGTRWLSQRQTGETIDIFGPMGNGFTLPDTPQDILLVAGGIGIAPLVFLAEKAAEQHHNVTLLLGTASKTNLVPDDIIPIRTNIFVTEDGSSGHRGLVTDWLSSNHSFIQKPIFTCGPLPMYRTMVQMPELKDKHVQVSLEIMMGCGVGVCYGCTIKTRGGLKQVCKDGPVFDFENIIWEETSQI